MRVIERETDAKKTKCSVGAERALAAAAAVLGVLLGAAPAGADWDYTQWGMTAPEVRAASRAPHRTMPTGRSTLRA